MMVCCRLHDDVQYIVGAGWTYEIGMVFEGLKRMFECVGQVHIRKNG